MATTPGPAIALVTGLVRTAHAGPSVVVTAVVAGLGLAAGVPPARLVTLLVAVLAGQLAIGWVNDLVDVDRDRLGGRRDKPLATPGSGLAPGQVRTAAIVALAVAVGASVLLGPVPAALHLAGVAAGLAYDLWLKPTAWSALPWAVAFGLVPAVTVAARPDPARAPWWAVAAGACFGVGVHLANALPDLAADAAADVQGLPQRLGRRTCGVVAPSVLAVGCALALVGGGATGGLVAVASALVPAGLLVAIVAATRAGADEAAHRLVMALGLATVALLVLRGRDLVA